MSSSCLRGKLKGQLKGRVLGGAKRRLSGF